MQHCQDINSPTDSVIGRDFQELSAEEQERQREEWKAELKKTEEEILTLKQVLTAKERHAAGGQQYYHTYCQLYVMQNPLYMNTCWVILSVHTGFSVVQSAYILRN